MTRREHIEQSLHKIHLKNISHKKICPPLIFLISKHGLHGKQDSRDSSPKPSSNMLDSLCPNCYEHLSRASQPSISAEHLSQASQQSSKMLSNAQQCSEIPKNFEIEYFSILTCYHATMLKS